MKMFYIWTEKKCTILIFLCLFSPAIRAESPAKETAYDNAKYGSLTSEQRIEYHNYLIHNDLFSLIADAKFDDNPILELSDADQTLINNTIKGPYSTTSSRDIRSQLENKIKSKKLGIVPSKTKFWEFRYFVCPQSLLDLKTKYENELSSYLQTKIDGQKLFLFIYDFWWIRESPLGPRSTENEEDFNIRLHALRKWKNYFKTLTTQEKKQKREIAKTILQKLKQISSIESTITNRCASLYVLNDDTEISAAVDHDLKKVNLQAKKVLTLQLPQQPRREINSYKYENRSDLENCSTEIDSFCPDRAQNIQCLYKNYRSLHKECQQVVFDLHKFEMRVFREEGIKFKFTVDENGYDEIKRHWPPISEGSNK